MGRPRPVPALEPPPAAQPARCVACRRTGTRREGRILADGSVAQVCVDPADCRRHWPVHS
jgi:hypothetical protein